MPDPPYIYADTWGYWNTNCWTANGTTTFSSIDSTDAWQNWNTGTASTTMAYIFENWVAYQDNHRRFVPTIGPGPMYQIRSGYAPPPRATAEEIAARQAEAARRGAEAVAAAEELRQARIVATERARGLLLDHLTAEQRADYEQTKHFNVTSRAGRRYRIACGRAHNVYRLNEHGLAIMEFCGHVLENVPDEDNILAQKLLLEHDEEAFLRIANAMEYADPRVLRPAA